MFGAAESPYLDVIVVGAGPAGLCCAIELQRRGIGAQIIEKGCVANSLWNFPTYMRFFTSAKGLEVGDLPMTSLEEQPGRAEAVEYYRRAAGHFRLDVRQDERVVSVEQSEHELLVWTAKRRFACRNVVLATGYCDLPNLLEIPGEDLPKVTHYYKEPHAYFGQPVAVVGGRNSAVTAALELYRAGARVTLIHLGSGLTSAVKERIRVEMEKRLKNGEIRGLFSSRLLRILPETIDIQTGSGVLSLPNGFVFAMTGYHPDIAFLRATGVELDAVGRPRLDPETLETNRPGVYLAGVVVSGMKTNELNIGYARMHAYKIASAIASKRSWMNRIEPPNQSREENTPYSL